MKYCQIVLNNELYHYGVKGMKWRKRKKRLLNEYTQDQIKTAQRKKYYGTVAQINKATGNNKEAASLKVFSYGHKRRLDMAKKARKGKALASKAWFKINP